MNSMDVDELEQTLSPITCCPSIILLEEDEISRSCSSSNYIDDIPHPEVLLMSEQPSQLFSRTYNTNSAIEFSHDEERISFLNSSSNTTPSCPCQLSPTLMDDEELRLEVPSLGCGSQPILTFEPSCSLSESSSAVSSSLLSLDLDNIPPSLFVPSLPQESSCSSPPREEELSTRMTMRNITNLQDQNIHRQYRYL